MGFCWQCGCSWVRRGMSESPRLREAIARAHLDLVHNRQLESGFTDLLDMLNVAEMTVREVIRMW